MTRVGNEPHSVTASSREGPTGQRAGCVCLSTVPYVAQNSVGTSYRHIGMQLPVNSERMCRLLDCKFIHCMQLLDKRLDKRLSRKLKYEITDRPLWGTLCGRE